MKDGKPTGIYEDFLAELLDNDTVWVGRQASRSRDGALLLGLLISESLERCGFFSERNDSCVSRDRRARPRNGAIGALDAVLNLRMSFARYIEGT